MRLLPAAFTLPEPIRPRHCPSCAPEGNTGKVFTGEVWASCAMCANAGGAGFLYPDPPDWMWEGALGGITREAFCHNAWRVLGVIEDTDA